MHAQELWEGGHADTLLLLQMIRGEMSEAELKQRQERAMADPEIQAILTDPIVRNVSACSQARRSLITN